jgi:hypothetical protein
VRPSRVAIRASRAGAVEAPWLRIFSDTVTRMAKSLADETLSVDALALVADLTLMRCTSDKPNLMNAMYLPAKARLLFFDSAFDGIGGRFDDVATCFSWIVMHEFSHIIDHSSNYTISREFGAAVGSRYQLGDTGSVYVPGNLEAKMYATTMAGSKSVFEDFAESLATAFSAGEYMHGVFGSVDSVRILKCAQLFRPGSS